MPLVAVHDSPDVVAIIPTLGADVARLTACVDSLTLSTGPTRLGILQHLLDPG